MEKDLIFRNAVESDTALILTFIKALADYEKMSDEVTATEEGLREWIFVKQKAEVIFAVHDGREVGFALFFNNFSTFLGKAGIYLEDLPMIQKCAENHTYEFLSVLKKNNWIAVLFTKK